MRGARLAYAVVKLRGTVKRFVYDYDVKKGGLVSKEVEQPAGYLVYFPMGHAVRVKDEVELAQIRFNGEPLAPDGEVFANMDGINSPNSKIGKLMRTQDKDNHTKLQQNFVDDVVKLVRARSGEITVTKEAEHVGIAARLFPYGD